MHVYTTAVDGPVDSQVLLETPIDVDGVLVTYFPSNFARKLFWSPSMKKALLCNVSKFDIVHLHTVFVWPVYVAAMAAKEASVPYVLTPRGMLEKALIHRKSWLPKSLWLHLCGKKVLSGAGVVQVTTSREGRELHRLGLKIQAQVLIPNGIDMPELFSGGKVKRNLWGEGEYILFLSRISWKKGLDRLIQAWAYGIDTPLIIAGNDDEGYTPNLMAIARKAGVADKVHFIGTVSGEEKWELYKHAEMLVLPSYSENFGNVVLEAMAVGCPVVVTPEVGLSEQVKAYGVGVVVGGEPVKLATEIKKLLADKGMLAEMGQRGIEAAKKHFSWSAICEQMEIMYMDLVRDGH